MTYLNLTGLRYVDSAYVGNPAVRWQTKTSPPDMVAAVADPEVPGRDWIILGNPQHGRIVLQLAFYDDDPERSEWASVDEAIGHVLGGAA